jgi:hypothetical protein
MTRDGQIHDLLIMSYDVAGFSNDVARQPQRRGKNSTVAVCLSSAGASA